MKTTGVREAPIPETSHSVCDSSSHPFDEWLRKELVRQLSTDDAETLPPEMASLASRLEEVLGLANGEKKHPDAETDSAEGGQPSAGDTQDD